MANSWTAAEHYANRVDAVLAQRTRLRGAQPPGDAFGNLHPEHPLLTSDPHRPADPAFESIAGYIVPGDIVVDVGGGAGRISLPVALRCREIINVDPSLAMGAAFMANARRSGITNARLQVGDWLTVELPKGTVALVNHVTYFVLEIVPFIERLEQAGPRRVVVTVHSPPPPSWYRYLYELVYGEPEEIVPGFRELAAVLWELGILPDIRVLSGGPPPFVPAPTPEAAIDGVVARFAREQWTFWTLDSSIERRVRSTLEARFGDLFSQDESGYFPRWIAAGREVLLTWRPGVDREHP